MFCSSVCLNKIEFSSIIKKKNIFLGCLATTLALSYGLWSFRNGKKKMSQYMMRTRVVAQGFTVVAMVLGVTMGAQKGLKKG